MLNKRILIIDDAGFSRVCSAILESEGYGTDIVTEKADILAGMLDREEFGLIITSYPYGGVLFKELKKRKIPTMILATHIDWDLINVLESFRETYCMIKPLNYQKFTTVVRQMMSGDFNIKGGYNIV